MKIFNGELFPNYGTQGHVHYQQKAYVFMSCLYMLVGMRTLR